MSSSMPRTCVLVSISSSFMAHPAARRRACPRSVRRASTAPDLWHGGALTVDVDAMGFPFEVGDERRLTHRDRGAGGQAANHGRNSRRSAMETANRRKSLTFFMDRSAALSMRGAAAVSVKVERA